VTAAAAAGAVERLRLALVPDLGTALAAARSAGVRVVGVVGGGPGAVEAPGPWSGPTVVVLAADGGLDRTLRARCDVVVTVADGDLAAMVTQAVATVAKGTTPGQDVDLREGTRSLST
jgi:tRNA G18 (ribose-2'-O)-methylase SpoU